MERAVPVVDDVEGEEQRGRVVDERPIVDLAADPEAGHEHLAHAHEEERDEPSEEVSAPAEEQRGEGDAGDGHHDGDAGCGHEGIHDDAAGVEIDGRADDRTEAAYDEDVSAEADEPAVAFEGDDDPSDGDHQTDNQEIPERRLPGHGDVSDDGAEHQAEDREEGDGGDVAALAQVVFVAASCRTFPDST